MAAIPHDLVNQVKKYKANQYQFFLDLQSWRKFKTRHKLQWQKIRFTATNHSEIPRSRGIYAFTVELSPSKLPMHGYIMYVGITGDKSNSNLHTRYRQYLREQSNHTGRPRVSMFLQNWKNDLFFNFVPLPNASINLAKLEQDFLNAIKPPINICDFDAEVCSIRKAAF